MSGRSGTPGSVLPDFRILGSLELFCGEDELGPFRRQVRKVLAILIARRGKTVTMDELIDLVWDGDPPDTAVAAVYNCIRAIREPIKRAGGTNPVETIGDREGYRLKQESGQFDDLQFTQMIISARRAEDEGEPEAAWMKFGQALALWRGDEILDDTDCPETLASAFKELHELRQAAREEYCDLGLRLKRHRDVLPLLRKLAEAEPVSEPVHGKLMLAECQAGHPDRAREVYERFRARHVRAHGVEPGPGIRLLYEQIRPGGPGFDPFSAAA